MANKRDAMVPLTLEAQGVTFSALLDNFFQKMQECIGARVNTSSERQISAEHMHSKFERKAANNAHHNALANSFALRVVKHFHRCIGYGVSEMVRKGCVDRRARNHATFHMLCEQCTKGRWAQQTR